MKRDGAGVWLLLWRQCDPPSANRGDVEIELLAVTAVSTDGTEDS